MTSLSDSGTPCSAPSGSAFMTAISASRAALRAVSAVTRQKALRVGLTAWMAARIDSVSSTGEICLSRMSRAMSIADRHRSSSELSSPPPHEAHCIIGVVTPAVARAWCEREGLAAPDHVQRAPHGTLAGFREIAGRLHRVVEFDRHGTLLSVLAWADGRLTSARLRLPDGGWLAIEPRAATDPRWGTSDRLVSPAGVFTHCEAVAWDDVDRIPVLAEPARVPPGGGSAVLNLLATLAADRARPALAYHGPYPTEALFLTLLESFRPEPPAVADPLAAFVSGALTWVHDPHERLF